MERKSDMLVDIKSIVIRLVSIIYTSMDWTFWCGRSLPSDHCYSELKMNEEKHKMEYPVITRKKKQNPSFLASSHDKMNKSNMKKQDPHDRQPN